MRKWLMKMLGVEAELEQWRRRAAYWEQIAEDRVRNPNATHPEAVEYGLPNGRSARGRFYRASSDRLLVEAWRSPVDAALERQVAQAREREQIEPAYEALK